MDSGGARAVAAESTGDAGGDPRFIDSLRDAAQQSGCRTPGGADRPQAGKDRAVCQARQTEPNTPAAEDEPAQPQAAAGETDVREKEYIPVDAGCVPPIALQQLSELPIYVDPDRGWFVSAVVSEKTTQTLIVSARSCLKKPLKRSLFR
jgi:hypothetical protein